jgi:hypothetical protein
MDTEKISIYYLKKKKDWHVRTDGDVLNLIKDVCYFTWSRGHDGDQALHRGL